MTNTCPICGQLAEVYKIHNCQSTRPQSQLPHYKYGMNKEDTIIKLLERIAASLDTLVERGNT